MPPRTKRVVNLLTGCVITVCGRLRKNHTHDSFKSIINQCGGRYVATVNKATTHIVVTDVSMHSKTVQSALAKREDLILMMPEWLIDIGAGKKRLDANDYTWPQSQTKIAKPNSVAKPKPPATPKKTPAKPTTAAKPKPKAAAKPKKTAPKSEPKAAAQSKASKPKAAAQSKASEPKAAAQSKTKARSKTKAKSKTSVEPLTEYDVWVDDSGLTYDAYLTQTNSVTNRDRYYRIQVRKDPESSTFKTRTEWAGVGKTPRYQVLGNGGLEDAVKEFEEKFESKSDLAWENRFANPVPEKYKYVHHSGGDNDTTDHS
ncbi:WGR domain [Fusarium oxysporum f. sp. vasinfectum]|nr:WGR domain [Fusarium oxysporum f. sp. vasinfectum]